MTRADWQFPLGVVAAVAVPAAVLHAATADERLAAGLSAAPFVDARLMVAHLAACVPLGLLAATAMRAALEETVSLMWVLVGLGVAGLATQVGPEVGAALADAGAGPLVALVARTAVALALVLPWCVAALGTPPAVGLAVRPGVAFALAAGFALVPAGLYSDQLVEDQTAQAADLLGRERLVRAEPVVGGLCELGSDKPVLGSPPAEAWAALRGVLPKLVAAADRPLAPDAAARVRLDRAVLLVRVERLEAASEVLSPLVPADATATLLLAGVRRDQERIAASDELFALAAERARAELADDPRARGQFKTAVESLVFNARADRRPADALRWLEYGRAASPGEEAFYDYQLGLHYQAVGRPYLAVELLESAAARDPALAGRVAGPLGQLRTHTPGCFLAGRPR